MTRPLAYHVVVHALEAPAGQSALARFASAVTHATDGHLPYDRYRAAGVARWSQGAREGVVQRMVGELLATDLNPATFIMGQLTHAANAVWALNAYTGSADVGVRTKIALLGDEDSNAPRFAVDRGLPRGVDDPVLCRVGVVAVMEYLVRKTERNAASHLPPDRFRLSNVARYLGVERQAAAELAALLECEGQMPIARAAQRLGVHQRTLERRLREEGVTADALRRATRLIEATRRLGSSQSLTLIAHEEGFSDLAHMSRAFRASCGMPPSLLRQAAHGGAQPERRLAAPRYLAKPDAFVAPIQANPNAFA